MTKTLEQIAARSVEYLKRTDALASHDYTPEIEAEFARALKEAIEQERERCARVADTLHEIGSIWRADQFGKEVASRIRALGSGDEE